MHKPNVIGGVRLPDGGGKTVRLRQGATLSDLAEKINTEASSLVQALFNLGEMVTATQSVSEDTLQLLGAEINYEVQIVSPEDEDRELLESFDLQFGEDEGGEEALEHRPPVVSVMGHVDHGKTRLLDSIRKANVGRGEAGGITQGIGAYQTEVTLEDRPRKITFLDTPGHEAFTAMRARGAKSTDLAILVVAADDGVMPQTVEAINHAKAAELPIVVAVNKVDKPEAQPDKIRGQLTEYGLVPEEYGGDTMFIDISAKQGTGIDDLLEAVLLTADAALELTANPDMDAQGVAIESHLDRGRGPVSTVIVQRGTLRVGDSIVVGGTSAACAAWSTSGATTWKRRARPARSRSRASTVSPARATTCSWSTTTAWPARLPRSVMLVSALRCRLVVRSACPWRIWIRRSRSAASSTSSSRATTPVRWRP